MQWKNPGERKSERERFRARERKRGQMRAQVLQTGLLLVSSRCKRCLLLMYWFVTETHTRAHAHPAYWYLDLISHHKTIHKYIIFMDFIPWPTSGPRTEGVDTTVQIWKPSEVNNVGEFGLGYAVVSNKDQPPRLVEDRQLLTLLCNISPAESSSLPEIQHSITLNCNFYRPVHLFIHYSSLNCKMKYYTTDNWQLWKETVMTVHFTEIEWQPKIIWLSHRDSM